MTTLSSLETRALADLDATEAFGAELAKRLRAPAVVYLEGGLGAGKTTLVRAFLRALGETGAVRSPTYTLIETYALPSATVHHLDLYRLGDAGELHYLGLDEMQSSPAIWLIEWPAIGEGVLPEADHWLSIEMAGEGRQLHWRRRHAPA